MLAALTATRYVTPLREGGSLPGLMETNDLGTYVVKFHGAGQGRKALVAEVISGELARQLQLPVPELTLVDVDPMLAANEPDEEVQDLLRASPGTNLGVDFLPGSLDLDTRVFPLSSELAGQVLWFDALVGNVDRSWRNPNMLLWHGDPYLIDHGATLTFHHAWARAATDAHYDPREHAALTCAPDLDAAEAALSTRIDETVLRAAVDAVPDVWLADEPGFADVGELRTAYVTRLSERFARRETWLGDLRAAVDEYGARPRVAAAVRNRPDWLGGAR